MTNRKAKAGMRVTLDNDIQGTANIQLVFAQYEKKTKKKKKKGQ